MMVAHDEGQDFTAGEIAEIKGLRELPEISEANVSQACLDVKAQFRKSQIEHARPEDDELLLQLDKEYVGKLWYDTEGNVMQLGGVRKKWKLTWKVLRISFREDCYEAMHTSIPVKQGANGEWAMYDEFLVKDGKGGTLQTHYKKHEWGVSVADLSNPDMPVRK